MTGETVRVVTVLTMPVMAGTALAAAAGLAGPSWIGGCGPVAEPWMAWAALWTMLVAGAVGPDGVLGGVPPVIAPTAPMARRQRARPEAGWLVGCDPVAEPGMAWAVLWTMLLTTGAAGEDGAWAVWPVPVAVLVRRAAGALVGVLAGAAGTLAGRADR